MSIPIKILHLEDVGADAEMIFGELKKGDFLFEYRNVKNKTDYKKQLATFLPDVILSTHILPEFSSKEALSIIKNADIRIPFIIITDSLPEETAINMARSGVSDYLFKDRLQRLHLAIQNAVKKSWAEKELLEQHAEVLRNEKRFRTLIENISDAILLLDSKGRVIYQSPSAMRISGFSTEESLSKSLFEFTHPGDLESVTRTFKQVILRPAVATQKTFRVQHKIGYFIWIEATITNFLHDENIKAIILTYRNITERKLSDQMLQKSEANLRTIFDNTNISYVLADKKFKIISFNSSAHSTYKKEFKIDIKEGDDLIDYIPEERRGQSKERFEKALKGEKVSYDMSFPQSSGNSTWYNVNMFAVRDDFRNLLGFIISSENITDRKSTELERTKMMSDIVVHNKDLEQFAYIISHNLRSPVANILGLTALITNSPDMSKESFDKCISGLSVSVEKLDQVIVDLNYILQTRREMNEKKEAVSFSGLINDIKMSISNQIEKENITINTNFTVNKFFTVKSYLYSIFYNLISNSIKYRNPAVATVIDIQSKKVNNKLIIEFKDNGLGIDMNAHVGKIFGLYKRFHKHVEGKGMGLYMVKTQVEILGGKISLASEVNKGTTFLVSFEE